MDIERLTARNKDGFAYLVNVKPDEQEVDSPHKNTLKCILDCFERLAQYEEEAIARQSVTSEEVAEAIELLKELQHHTENDVKNHKLISLAITALQAYQPTISKTETTSCEWCEIASACEYEVTFFKDDDRWATVRSLLPKYCPNCGRRLED